MTHAVRTRFLVVAAMVAALVPTVGAAPAAAQLPEWNEAKKLSIDTFHQVILDEANQQLFLRSTDEVFVANYSGQKLKRIKNIAGDGLMALSQDGASVWVALTDVHAIARIDTTDLVRAEVINLPAQICPTSVAETNGKLAVGHDCDGGLDGIGTVDLSDDGWTNSSDPNVPEDDPIVVSSPGAPDIVVAGDRNGSAEIRVFDVSSGDPSWVAGIQSGSDLNDLAFDPGGNVVVEAAGSQSVLPAFLTPRLAKWKEFEGEPTARALAWSGNGSVLVAASAEGGGDVHIYKRSAKKAKLTHEVDGEVAVRGVAIDAAAQHVWVVSELGGEFLLTLVTGLGWGKCKGRFPNYVGTDGDDTIIGTSRVDVVVAGDGNDTIDTGGGDDVICAQRGNDVISPGSGDDLISGGAGRDTLDFSAVASEGIVVDLDARTVTGYGTKSLQRIENVIGTAGDDTLIGDGKVNSLDGGPGDDTIDGLGKNDILSGGPGVDYIEGGYGNDKISGNAGEDLLIGEGGRDRILGGADDDILAGVTGDDTLIGGPGADTASFAIATKGITASLTTGKANGEGADTLKQIEWIVGSEQKDTLIGNGGVNLLESRGGNDTIEGLAGDDTLNGGEGTDTLNGGSGNDTCLFGEVHISCEDIQSGVARQPAWPAAVWAAAEVWLPRTRIE